MSLGASALDSILSPSPARLTVDIDSQTLTSLKIVAARRQTTVRAIVSEAILPMLERHGETPSEELRRLALRSAA